MNYLYGPLGKDWCMVFYYFSIFYFLLIFITSFFVITYAMGKNPNIYMIILKSLYVIFNILLYIQFRILNGMCINTVN